MTRIRGFARILAVALVASALAVPMVAQSRGSAVFTSYYVVGDSYGAGFESGSLNINHQQYGWPAIIAKQVGLQICPVTAAATDNCWALPLVSYPGLPGGESQLTLVGSSVIPVPAPGAGSPLMFGFGRSYNNLAVPGYTVGATLALTGAEPTSGLGQVILRGRGTEVDQVIAAHPTFVAIWIGGNDFLGAVSNGKPSLLTSSAAFSTAYNAMLDKLVAGAPTAGMVVGTLPANFKSTPLTNTLPSVVFDSSFKPVSIGGSTVPLFGDLGDGTIGALPAGTIVLLSAAPRISQGFGIPPALKAFPPFNALPHAGEPLADSETITPAEQAVFTARIADYNATITAAAAARNIPVADIKGLFDSFASPSGIAVGPVAVITNTFVTGGIYSFDGVHLSDMGYSLFANQYIKAINAGYGTHIPLAPLAAFLQNNDPGTAKALASGGPIVITEEFAKQMIAAFAISQPAPPRRRLTVH